MKQKLAGDANNVKETKSSVKIQEINMVSHQDKQEIQLVECTGTLFDAKQSLSLEGNLTVEILVRK